MSWIIVLWSLGIVNRCIAINKPVYKIMLTQKGFAQFLEYDVEIPPLREFTICTWIRVYDLQQDQSIFNYIVNGNNRLLRVWLDSGGRHMYVSINDVTSSVPVDIPRDVWRHVCLSYQSDFGAWALYIDSHLLSCEAAQRLLGFVIPKNGSIIIGYGSTKDDRPSGLEGEIFGTNMLLKSTIERNITLKHRVRYEQKVFKKDKLRSDNEIEYVILKDLKLDEMPINANSSAKYNNLYHHHFIDHDIIISKEITTKSPHNNLLQDNQISPLKINLTPDKHKMNNWDLVNKVKKSGYWNESKGEQSGSGTHEVTMISEFETPPPMENIQINLQNELEYMKPPITETMNFQNKLEFQKPPVTESIYNFKENFFKGNKNNNTKHGMAGLIDYDIAPAPMKTEKVYGQWTSSRFANNVLDYLKKNNFQSKNKRVPATIPLTKLSDAFPYATDLKISVVKPPITLMRKKIIIEKNRFNSQNTNMFLPIIQKYHARNKRNTNLRQRNVEILENDLRSEILKLHAQTQPKLVQISSRGETNKVHDHRFYRDVSKVFRKVFNDSDAEGIYNKNTFETEDDLINNNMKNNFLTVLPFLKSVEYFTETAAKNNMYTKTLSNANIWHNIKSYDEVNTPRHMEMKIHHEISGSDYAVPDINTSVPSISMTLESDSNKLMHANESNILKGRELASKISNNSNLNKQTISIFKYNHGFLPSYKKRKSNVNITKHLYMNTSKHDSFNKHVKIGNALNEQYVIGLSDEQRKKSFIGGNDEIPDIHRYRSDLDKVMDQVPSSLKPRICINFDTPEYILYVLPDGSIDRNNILSPIKQKNIGIEFIMQNYKRCSLDDSILGHNPLLLLHWNKTPVRLFGGATPKKTKDLCGFF